MSDSTNRGVIWFCVGFTDQHLSLGRIMKPTGCCEDVYHPCGAVFACFLVNGLFHAGQVGLIVIMRMDS